MFEEESKSNIHRKQRYFIDQQNSIQGQTLKAMCFKNDEFDFLEYERNNEIQLYNKECYLNQPENQLKQLELQQIGEYKEEIDFPSIGNIVSPNIDQDLTKFQNCNEETIEYIKKNSNPLNLRDKRLSQSKQYTKSGKSFCQDRELNRQYTTKSIIKPIRSFSSLNQISFNCLESQNRKFYEKLRNKMKFFYLNATLSGRTKLINLIIKNQINDLSDFIPEKLNTQVQNYEIVGNRKGIIQIYLRYSVFFDIFPILFLFFNLEDRVPTLKIIFQIAVFLKIKNILQDISYIQSQFCMMLKRYYIIQVVNLVLKLFLIGHTIACFWYILCKLEYENYQKENCWINNQMLQDKEWWQFYIFSLYWALTLMTTGSSIASTTFETCYTVFIMLFITIIFGYILNVIGQILSEIEEKDQNRRRDVNILNDYMRKKNISKLLQSKVNLNLEYYYQQDFKQLQENYEQVLGKISLDLKNSLLKEYNKQIINKIEVIAKKFSQNALDQLSITLQEEYYFPNQAIFNQHDLLSNCIIYVVSGQVEISASNNTCKQTKILLNSGQFYGLIEFFTGVSNNLHVYSKQFSQVVFINRNKFIEIIKQNEKDFQEFHQLKDQIFLYGKLGYPISQKQDRAIFNRKKECKQQFFAIKSQQQKDEFFKYAQTFKNLDESYNSSHSLGYSYLTQSQQENEESSVIQNNNSVFFGSTEGRNNTFKSQNPISEQKIKKPLSQTCLSKIEIDLNPQLAEERKKKSILSFKINSEINDSHMDKNYLKREPSDQDITKQEAQRKSRQSLDSQQNQQILDLGKNYIYDNDIGFSNDQRVRAYFEDLNRFLFQRGRYLKQAKPVFEVSQMQNNFYEQEDNPWLFESLENFKYYFTKGNSFNVLKKLMKQRKKSRTIYKKNLKSENKLNK
ncbi:cyclic nucleotide-binding domain protein (macronuclear) [Tetrahymena thermophila SB210]|uniref:Cyclic nucleotide-binding domain protein n=1 Tax=Tetrahymena thermophila (strain SB210) TaxID=312017 RepID=Q23G17_TETTS|nr:cyclic nucleotide-binding domain protein [Tetrahymena thermophila SB210]EAR95443.3 cyclic nucleotide-binding domain protein [Tetrahymena thermophila SB210]|eukprot:XP_001015688.3 cyclic nucleotide-binding domain protein [Tetrahymena thermophila SB210]